jgi:hypothetical protein
LEKRAPELAATWLATSESPGDGLVQPRTAGDLHQMGLAPALGDFDEIIAGQLLGLRQNRAGDLDRIVGRKPTDDPGRSIGDRRNP